MKMKKSIVKATNDNYLVTVTPPDSQMELGKQINYFQEVVKQTAAIGCTAAIINGVLLTKAQVEHPQTFQDWLTANTAVSIKTSYNYINAAKRTLGSGIVEELAKKGTVEIAESVTQAMMKLKLESKPLTELYCDVGIIKRTPSKMGGRREGAGRPRKDAQEELARQAEEIAAKAGAVEISKTVGDLFVLGVSQDLFGTVGTVELKEQIDTLEKVLKRAKDILRSRKNK